MLLWSSSLSFVLFQVTPSQTTSFFCFVHTFPPPLLPSMCASFFTSSGLLTFTFFPLLLYLSLPFLYTPSMCLFINKFIHPLPGDRNESPARLSNIWWACYDCFCPHRPFFPLWFLPLRDAIICCEGIPAVLDFNSCQVCWFNPGSKCHSLHASNNSNSITF